MAPLKGNQKRKRFTFHRTYYEAAKKLPPGQRLAFYDAIIGYRLNGDETDTTGEADILFKEVMASIDAEGST